MPPIKVNQKLKPGVKSRVQRRRSVHSVHKVHSVHNTKDDSQEATRDKTPEEVAAAQSNATPPDFAGRKCCRCNKIILPHEELLFADLDSKLAAHHKCPDTDTSTATDSLGTCFLCEQPIQEGEETEALPENGGPFKVKVHKKCNVPMSLCDDFTAGMQYVPNLRQSADKKGFDSGNWLLIVVLINIIVVAAELIHRIVERFF